MPTRSSGFTLIELLVVVAILGIIAAIGISSYNGYVAGTKQKSVENAMMQMSLGQTEYYSQNGYYYPQKTSNSCNPTTTTTSNIEKYLLGDGTSGPDVIPDEVGYIELSGQFKFPGMYTVNRGETLSQVMKRAGGLTDQAYLHGAIFTRESVARQQKVSAERSADYLEQSIADTIMSGTIQNLTAGSLGPVSELIKKLRDLTPIGRIVVDVNPVVLKADPTADFEVKDGDKLIIPKRPTSITIVGEVISPNSITFKSGINFNEYIQNAGGFKDSANKSGVFAIMPNGEVKELTKSFLFKRSRSNLIPGTTIVVPRDPEPFNWLVLTKTITPILADTATAIATVEALLD